MSFPLVYTVILNWNGLADTTACLDSLKKVTYPDYRVVVVDNGSKDNEGLLLKEIFGNYVHLIQNAENLGFVGGNNIGIRHALDKRAHYVLLLNNDTTVEPDFLNRLVAAGETYPTIGILGPKVYLDRDRRMLWSAGGLIDYITSFTYKNTQAEPYNFYSEVVRVGYIIGAAMLIKREVIEKIGLLDERFFAYEEDIEYCVRAYRHNYDSALVTTSVVYHSPGSSTQAVPELPYYYQNRNSYLKMRAIFADNEHRIFYGTIFMMVVNLINMTRAFRDEGWAGWRRAWAAALGMWDALATRRFGKTKRFPH